ncbi:MAG: ribbon-helix-helix protein, CopG family [Polyangiaceae bacterium]|nr:ribbon-helix-helix protein, CopG family [Polyangiaceae bacterium]
MNVHTMKIAVSLPAKTLRSVEATRRRLGRSRSSVVAEALESWLEGHTSATEDARYLEGYARYPEPDDGAVAAAVMATWDDWSGRTRSVKRMQLD